MNLHSTMLLLYLQRGRGAERQGFSFTFHYASTLSLYDFRDSHRCVHLHSTMLLLYPVQERTYSKSDTFTFHYASTLS